MTQYTVTLVLAESATLQEATPAILRGIGESLGLQLSIFWRADEQAGVLRFVDLWHSPKIDASEFIEDSRDQNFHQGTELIKRVWKAGKPFWARDIGAATGFRRAPMAIVPGLPLHAPSAYTTKTMLIPLLRTLSEIQPALAHFP